MNFNKILEALNKKKTSLILYCLLDRIPIIIFGDETQDVDEFLVELSELIHFRKDLVFYTDFVSKEEYQYVIQNEDVDYNSQKAQYRCPCNVALKALETLDRFDSWLIGILSSQQKLELNKARNLIRKKIPNHLKISLSSNKISIELEGLNAKSIDLTLESDILQKITQDTEKSITRMKRVLSEKIRSNSLDEGLITSLLDFEAEKDVLKKNILRKELQNFYSGSKRAFFILSKLNLVHNLNINTKIGTKTLLKTIDYDQAPIDGVISAPIHRMISFIYKEWGEDFSHLIENGKRLEVEDKIQSLWG